MRKFLGTVNFSGIVVIGEGEKDHAPMLFNGWVIGNGNGPECDIAVDPSTAPPSPPTADAARSR